MTFPREKERKKATGGTMMGETVKIEKKVMKKNEELAAENREFFVNKKLKCVNMMGSVGSGKTSILERLAERLGDKMFVINGDCTTTIDADRIESKGARTFQINTGKGCHLNAGQVQGVIQKEDLEGVEIVFIENVGNLICPAGFVLGEDFNVAVISITEGPWVVKKHPHMFKISKYVVINKTDLATAMEIDPAVLIEDVKTINPRATPVAVSAKLDEGIDEFLALL
ncbi:MAG: hydrogenase nickel incorporation protein HypB [Candidatus Hodarchaeales archaeon]